MPKKQVIFSHFGLEVTFGRASDKSTRFRIVACIFLDLFTRPRGDMSGLISVTKINLKRNVFGLITAYIVGLIAAYEMDLTL